MLAAHAPTIRRLACAVATAALVAGALPAEAVAASTAPARAGAATGAAAPGGVSVGASIPGAGALAALPGAGPTASAPAAGPAADIRQPTVREIALRGINKKLLARAPAPQPHTEGQVGALAVTPTLKPALAAKVNLSKRRAAALVAVVADEPFGEGTEIRMRIKDRAGWSRWIDVHVDPEHGPDPGSPEAARALPGSDPVLAVRARKIRIRIDTPTGRVPPGTRLSVVKAPSAPSDARTGQMAALGTVGQPPIVTRAQWGADESLRRRAPYYTDNIRAGFVHHTASTSNYSPSQAAAQIRAIYAYHTKSLGHSDIDYNFVVDRFGRLYEGRYGGMDRPVLGGHTAGFNEHTFAVVALGNFETFSPPSSDLAAMKESIARLFAWKLGLHGVSPGATVKLVSAGYIKATRYPKGSVATISATSSHQTVNYTACPGKYLQRELSSIRALGDKYSDVVLTAPSPTGQSVQAGSAGSVSFSSFADRAVAWRADVLSPCSDTPVRTYTGSTRGAGSVSVGWDLRDSSGTPVLPATYTVRLSGTASDGTPVTPVDANLTVTPAPGGAWGPCANASRVAGEGASQTSILWGRIHAPDSKVVVLTGSEDTTAAWSTGLVAAPLARSLRAPLLLTPSGSLAGDVAGEIRARGATEVLVVGGTDVVSDSVAAAAAGLGARVTRLGGATPAATAVAVANRMGTSATAVLVTPDGSPAHALAGSGLAAARGVPLLLGSRATIPAETQAGLAGRTSVTVAASSALSDATVSAALKGIAWDRVSGSDAVGASVAVAAAFPAAQQVAAILPETSSAWAIGPVAAASGSPVLLTASPVLSPAVADLIRARPSLRATLTPITSRSLDDGVLGATSRVLLGLPWAPAGVTTAPPAKVSTVTATSKRKVYRANAKPEPARRGSTMTVTAKVKAKFTDRKYRKVPAGVAFKVQFKAKGKKKYRTKAYGTTTTGRATATVTAKKSGRWRIVVGKKKSKSDYVRVRR
jgi:hypothetical protein